MTMVVVGLVCFAWASPPALEEDGLELSRERWLNDVSVVFAGEVVERLEPLWLVDGLFSTDTVGTGTVPLRIERTRLRVDDEWDGEVLDTHVELWENAKSVGVLHLEVGDQVIVLGGLWDLRSSYGRYSPDAGSASYAAESVYALSWRVMRVQDGRVWTWNRGVPVCPATAPDALLVPCDGDEGALLEDVKAALTGVLPDGGGTLPGVP